MEHRQVLYFALFLHDIAKGRPVDHSIEGARIARRLGPRFGFSAADTELVAWLVEQHLTMSIIAQSRDLADRKTIRDFAAVVQTLERMKLLLILTVADIRAVGPNVWNGWKGQLLRTLYYETEPFLLGGHSQMSRVQRVEAAKAELAMHLDGWSDADRERILDRHYAPYWLRVDLPEKLAHADLLRRADTTGRRLATAWTTKQFEAVTQVTVVAPDHPRLLATLAGACTAAGANIVDAQIFTTTDGFALDTIVISREFPDDADENRRAERIARLIEATLEGRERLPEIVARRVAARKAPRAFVLPTEVRIDNSLSENFTVIEISALDRPGLLWELTKAISGLNLNIASAHVATFGERAVDVFYVTDLTNQKIASATRQATIRRRLLQAVDEAASDKPSPRKAG
jgi:[protein-PII] uridylyltransferase